MAANAAWSTHVNTVHKCGTRKFKFKETQIKGWPTRHPELQTNFQSTAGNYFVAISACAVSLLAGVRDQKARATAPSGQLISIPISPREFCVYSRNVNERIPIVNVESTTESAGRHSQFQLAE